MDAPAEVAGRAAGAVFAAVSRLRGAKSLHPKGMVFEASLEVYGGDHAPAAATLLSTPGEHRAVVRFSRSVGLPEGMPDLFGIALRLPDVHGPGRHQDLLAVTSVDAPVLHHIFVPVTDPQQAPYSSSLPYRAGGELFLIGMQPLPGSPRRGGTTIEERLERAAATGRLEFSLSVAPLSGRFRPIGRLTIGERLPDDLERIQFNPWNTGGGLEPAGIFNRMRARAYPASQEGWDGSQ